jgi:hypothetical protein
LLRPGFSAKALLDWLCQAYTECKDDYATGKEAFGDNLPKLVQKGSTGYTYCVNELPKGWDGLETFQDAFRNRWVKRNAYGALYGIGDGGAFPHHIANSILLGFAVVGSVFVIVGLVVEPVKDDGKNPEE